MRAAESAASRSSCRLIETSGKAAEKFLSANTAAATEKTTKKIQKTGFLNILTRILKHNCTKTRAERAPNCLSTSRARRSTVDRTESRSTSAWCAMRCRSCARPGGCCSRLASGRRGRSRKVLFERTRAYEEVDLVSDAAGEPRVIIGKKKSA